MLKRGIAVLVALVVGTAVIYGGVTLYRMRHDLFRPDVDKVGGTEVTFDLLQGAEDEDMDRACEVLRKRIDEGAAGVTVRRDGAKRLAIVVPNSRRHDHTVNQARRLAPGRGAVEFRLLADASFDKDASELAQKRFLAMKDVPAKPGQLGDEIVVGGGGGVARQRYRWASLNDSIAREWLRRAGGSSNRLGGAERWVESVAVVGSPQLFCLERGVGGTLYFVLTLEPEDGQRIDSSSIRRVRVVESGGRSLTRVEVTLTQDAAARLIGMFGKNIRQLTCLLDGEGVGEYDYGSIRGGKVGLYLWMLPTDAEDVAAMMRGGELPVKLNPTSVKEHPVAPKR